jgi:flagellar basal body-associated protein FliL
MEEDLQSLRQAFAEQNVSAERGKETLRHQLQKEIEKLKTELQFKVSMVYLWGSTCYDGEMYSFSIY